MGNLAESLNRELSSLVKEAPSLKAAKKEDLREYIGFLIANHRSFINAFSGLSDKERRALADKMKSVQGSNLKGINAYISFKSKLRGAAYKAEDASFMSSLEYAVKEILTVLDSIDEQLDNLFINDKISVLNAKLSHLAIFGALAISRSLHRLASYTLHAVTNDIAGDFDVVPQYRMAFIEDNAQDVATAVNKIYEKNGINKLLVAVANLKKDNHDIQLVGENNNVNTGFIRESEIDRDTSRMMLAVLPRLNIFKAVGEWWNNLKHWYMMEIKGSKEYMEAQTRILQLKINDSEDEAERARLEKIVRNYNDQITKVERKLAQYQISN